MILTISIRTSHGPGVKVIKHLFLYLWRQGENKLERLSLASLFQIGQSVPKRSNFQFRLNSTLFS
jgi:hypothetical protein